MQITLTTDELKQLLDKQVPNLTAQVDPAKMAECLGHACDALSASPTQGQSR